MPAALNRAMTVLYPTSLGVDEALADLCVRAYSSMMAEAGLLTALTYWVLYFKIVLGTVAGVLSAVFYMPYVYRRYETTVALPIECAAHPPPPPPPPPPPSPAPITTSSRL